MNLNFRDDSDFLKRLTEIVEVKFKDESFGVSDLVKESGLSHSVVHRRLKTITKQSVSQFIRAIRLQKAKELLEKGKLTVSEIAYEVGFGSPSYFIRCFHEQFGYPPGETKNHITTDSDSAKQSSENPAENETTKQVPKLLIATVSFIFLLGAYFLFLKLSGNFSINDQNSSVEKSIMVLPFKNLSTDENNQYFADGITEDILNQLTKITRLKVVSRTSAEQFRESTLSLPEIAEKMKVNYILEGSVRRQEEDVRISVQLIDARNDHHLWSENYDRQLADIFSIQSDIAQNVASQLQSILSPKEIKQIEKRHPKNAEAYDKYLMGEYLCLKRDSLSIRRGIEYFEQAIELDSTYTLAYAGLANAYYALGFTGNVDRKEGFDMAYHAAEKALEMDSTLAEAYAVLGIVSYFGYWEWEKARGFLEKAIEVDSNCMVAHLYYSNFLDIVGESEKALEEINKANELEPYYHAPFHIKGIILRNEKKYLESNKAFSDAIALNPGVKSSRWDQFENYIDLNDEESAIIKLHEIFSVTPEFQSYSDSITPIYETSGINGVIRLFLDAILVNKNPDLRLVASLYNRLEMHDEALNWLERSCRENFADVSRNIRRSEFESLHSDPRFLALVDTMNLRPYFQVQSE